jgi:hypothetical protein
MPPLPLFVLANQVAASAVFANTALAGACWLAVLGATAPGARKMLPPRNEKYCERFLLGTNQGDVDAAW